MNYQQMLEDLKEFMLGEQAHMIRGIVKEEVADIRVDVAELKTDVAELKRDVKYLKAHADETDLKLDAIMEASGENFANHEKRITKLEKARA